MNILKIIVYLLCYILYPMSFLMPRTKKIMIYGSYRGGFNDNSKHLFIYATNHYAQYRHIWISTKLQTVKHIRSLGLKAYWVVSPIGIYYALRGRYWFVNAYTADIAFFLSGGATIINLWHGLPWKCIEFGIKKGVLAKRYTREDKLDAFLHPACFIRPDYIASSSDFVSDIFSFSFRINKNQCISSGYPRNHLFSKSKDEILSFIDRYDLPETHSLAEQIQKYNIAYIYMPTWRDSQRNLFAKGLNLEALNTVMQEQNALMIMKPHPNTASPEHNVFSNLLFMDRASDVYTILPLTDVLITDYSSVMFDYPLMPGKGMILYQYDYEEYLAEREFNFPPEGNIIGRKVTSFEELLDVIRRKDYRLDEKERAMFLNKFWGHTATDNACDIILEIGQQKD